MILRQIQSILKHPLTGKKTSNKLPILNAQTMACAGFDKRGQIERVWGTSPGDGSPQCGPGDEALAGGLLSPRSWSTFPISYMKFSCHVTADVTKNAGLLERTTNEIVQIVHTLWKYFKQSDSAQVCFTHTLISHTK